MSGRGRMSRGLEGGDHCLRVGGGGWRGRRGNGLYTKITSGVGLVSGLERIWVGGGVGEMTHGVKMRFLDVLVPMVRLWWGKCRRGRTRRRSAGVISISFVEQHRLMMGSWTWIDQAERYSFPSPGQSEPFGAFGAPARVSSSAFGFPIGERRHVGVIFSQANNQSLNRVRLSCCGLWGRTDSHMLVQTVSRMGS